MVGESGRFDSSEKTDDTTSGTKSKKKLRFGVPGAKVETAKDQPSKKTDRPEPPKGFGEALSLLIDKNAAEKKTAEAADANVKNPQPADKAEQEITPDGTDEATQSTPEKGHAVPETETTRTSEAELPDPETDYDAEPYKQMLEQELRPGQFGSEVVVNLNGDSPVAEQFIPLRHGADGQEQPERSRRMENPYPVFIPQEQEQHRFQDTPEAAARQLTPETPAGPGAIDGDNLNVAPVPLSEQSLVSLETSAPNVPSPPLAEILSSDRTESEAGGSAITPDVSKKETPATAKEVDEALRRNTRVNGQRGALSGLLFGAYFANRRLRHRQIQTEKELTSQGKELEQVTKDLQVVTRVQERQRTNTERRFATTEKRLDHDATSQREKVPLPGKTEQSERVPRREVRILDPTEQTVVPKDHRLETSAWHTIEVDSKTGKPVETPTFQYGHEYYRERAQENLPADQRNAAAGGVALSAAAMGQASGADADGQAGSTPPRDTSHIPNASSQGEPKKTAQVVSKLKSMAASDGQAGPIWPWIVALVAVVLCIVVALR